MSLREAMDRLFESSVVRPQGTARESQAAATLAVNMYEDEDNLYVVTRVPGVLPENLDITATEEAITLEGTMTDGVEAEDENRRWYHRELWTGRFSRVIPLTTRVQLDKIEAEFEHGLLQLTIPKAEEVKPKSIKVNIK